MQEYQQMITRQKRWLFYYLIIVVVGTVATSFHSIFNGLLLGSVVSSFNLWLLQCRVQKLGEAVVKGKKTMGIGTIVRFTLIVLTLFIAETFAQYFHFFAVIAGIMTMYVVIMIDALLFQLKD
ncbi:hypothetical protein GCM10011351_18340 [Paraliobacillus quinghaiensis]|uniref:ATP synthase subunit I n=2 Tax=Paraliobacillus quinghaiensis TaxID=470815 RepID=A0A917WU53_9BACI|nr:hypothetical protein GCM10011351_18340 [Paraliobacillus quinghaiensis]